MSDDSDPTDRSADLASTLDRGPGPRRGSWSAGPGRRTGRRPSSTCARTTPRPSTPSTPRSTSTATSGREFVDRWGLFEVATRAGDKAEYLLRPDLGRRLDDAAARRDPPALPGRGRPPGRRSATASRPAAVVAQVPGAPAAAGRRGRPARAGASAGRSSSAIAGSGVLNDIGDRARARRRRPPDRRAARAWRPPRASRPTSPIGPRPGQTDAHRNLISNIHARGTPPDGGRRPDPRLADQMMPGSGRAASRSRRTSRPPASCPGDLDRLARDAP